MADDPTRGRPDFDPLPGWPNAPVADQADTGRDAPPGPAPGWSGARPERPQPVLAPAGPPPARRRPLDALRTRRGLVIAAAVVAVLFVGGIAAIVMSGGDGDGGGSRGTAGAGGSGGSRTAPAGAAGREIRLLDGRIVVVSPEGWEPLDASADTASIRVNLREAAGRELLGTLVLTALPGVGSLDALLTVDGATRFEVKTATAPLPATAIADRGQVLAGAVRPNGRVLVTLSVHALDGNGVDAALLQKLFTEQVAPQLRFP